MLCDRNINASYMLERNLIMKLSFVQVDLLIKFGKKTLPKRVQQLRFSHRKCECVHYGGRAGVLDKVIEKQKSATCP